MIPHLGMELALKETEGDRPAARALIREGILRQAELEARLAGLSLKCRIDFHTLSGNGCLNDGSSCLCACHDLPEGSDQ
jgi:hypothetical protein